MKVAKKIWRVIATIICVAISVGIFGVEIGLHSLVIAQNVLKKDNIKEIIMNVDFKEIFEDAASDDDELVENLNSTLNNVGISKNAVNRIMYSDSFKELFAEYVSSTVDYVFTGNNVSPITVDGIMKVVKDNMDIIEEDAKKQGITLTQKKKEELLKSIEKELPAVVEAIPNVQEEFEKDPEAISAIKISRKIVNPTVIGAFIGVIVVLTLLISLLRFNIHEALLWLGIPTIFSGVAVIFIGQFANVVKTVLVEENMLLNLSNSFFESIFNPFIKSGFVGLLIGLLCIILFAVIRKIREKKITSIEM